MPDPQGANEQITLLRRLRATRRFRPGAAMQESYDEGRLSEQIMLAAEAYGVGSCIGWFSGDSEARAKQILGVPAERVLRTAVSLGYADEEARAARPKPAQARKPLAAMLSEERYGRPVGQRA